MLDALKNDAVKIRESGSGITRPVSKTGNAEPVASNSMVTADDARKERFTVGSRNRTINVLTTIRNERTSMALIMSILSFFRQHSAGEQLHATATPAATWPMSAKTHGATVAHPTTRANTLTTHATM